ncbi:MAG: hypothetical protein EXQ96_05755 [Alphaproteobacteria bacterium]|nr:hypothetical protein [Alphaproteobacteria bacterium]
MDTHGAVVFLAGPRAYKLKRAVAFDYMDFSTLALRDAATAAELRVNRRTAPDLYRGRCAITREANGRLRFDGIGAVLDWVVEMRRFDQECLFDRLAGRGALSSQLLAALVAEIVRFHAAAERSTRLGGTAGMRSVIDGNRAAMAGCGLEVVVRAAPEVHAAATGALHVVAPLLEARRAGGCVRNCHGDLHLGNIFLDQGRPVLFDAIEFNDSLAWIDTFYDLAFLLMDLRHRGLAEAASTVLNRHADPVPDPAALAALPLFLSLRAAIRAHTSAAAAARQPAPDHARGLAAAAGAYLDQSRAYLAPPRPRLVAIGGLSGSGKSSLAYALAHQIGAAPGARVIRSDVIRKRLLGGAETARLGADAYRREVTERVYRALLDEAAATLAAGHAVIADAVFGRPGQRAAIGAIAAAAAVPFTGLWLEAPAAVLEARVGARTLDASDADVGVVRRQLAYDVGRVDWARIDAAGEAATTLAAAGARLADGS